jgi:hypothetical protein
MALLGSHLWSREWRRDRRKKKEGGQGLEFMGGKEERG